MLTLKDQSEAIESIKQYHLVYHVYHDQDWLKIFAAT